MELPKLEERGERKKLNRNYGNRVAENWRKERKKIK